MKPKVLLLSFSPIASDPRVLRQISALSEHFDVATAGYGASPDGADKHYEIADISLKNHPLQHSLRLLLQAVGAYRLAEKLNPSYRAAFESLQETCWDLVLANDVEAVPVARKLQSKFGYICDLHEFSPRQHEHSYLWRLLIPGFLKFVICNYIAKETKEVTTVSNGIAAAYEKLLGFKPELVINASPRRADLRAKQINGPIKLVHSGIPEPARKLEIMIQGVMQSTADITMDLFLMETNLGYLNELKSLVAADSRISINKPVSYSELVSTLNQYDVGISILPPTTFNLEHCLPNKFFDYIQAKLGIIAGPTPEMVHVLEDTGVGTTTADFSADSFTELLNNLSHEQVIGWKKQTEKASQELSSEQTDQVWMQLALKKTFPK